MIASLMMYNRPELAEAHDIYWNLIRRHLGAAGIASPATLSQSEDEFVVWKHPRLVLSQTCGMPYRLKLHGQVNLVGTPDFALNNCPAGYYQSAIITHADNDGMCLESLKNSVFAYNQKISQSGYAAIYAHTASRGFWFTQQLQTHSHVQSARAVADKRASVAAIDAVTWRLIQQYEPFAASLKLVEWTEPTPGLPYITAKTQDPEPVFNAVKAAITELPDDVKQTLGIVNLLKIPVAEYLGVPNPPQIRDGDTLL